MSWIHECDEYVVNIWWICNIMYSQYIHDVLITYLRFHDIFINMSWSREYAMNLSWISCEYVMNMWWMSLLCVANNTRGWSGSLEGSTCYHFTAGRKTEGKPDILQGSFSFIFQYCSTIYLRNYYCSEFITVTALHFSAGYIMLNTCHAGSWTIMEEKYYTVEGNPGLI